MKTFTAQLGNLQQTIINGDLEKGETLERFKKVAPETIALVYSDPPWNPGNASYWRTHASLGPCESYDRFLSGWAAVARECVDRGATDVFVEQSSNPNHYGLLQLTLEREEFPLAFDRLWLVRYGSGKKKLPNALLHYGPAQLSTDPTDMFGDAMTMRVFAGLSPKPHTTVVDPCTGLGMTSRMAHYFQLNFAGVELNEKRLARTVAWLEKQGYEVTES